MTTSVLSGATIVQEIAGNRSRHPYYVVTPRFLHASAGIRVLHYTAHFLNLMGEEAYVAIAPYDTGDESVLASLRTPCLTQEIADHHHQSGLTPIVIYSETVHGNPLEGGVTVRYLLNAPGLLGGPCEFPATDYFVSYSQALAALEPANQRVLFLPVSDHQFFTPGPPRSRSGHCVYAGKYVDLHDQKIPAHLLDGAIVITRAKAHSQTREELRELFRTRERLYVFENTALATEAALCGCIVICVRNPYFDGLLAEAEHGLDGIAYSENPAELERARRTVGAFRDAYLRSFDRFGAELAGFVRDTQAIADAATGRPRVRIPQLRSVQTTEWVSRKIKRALVSRNEIGTIETIGRIVSNGLRKARAKYFPGS